MKIAVLGAKGSFTQEAGESYCKKHHLDFEPIRRESAHGVFSAVVSGKAEVGIVPIANSTAGVVLETIRSMSAFNFSVVSLIELPISQNLLIRRDVSLKDIEQIASHSQAFAQCRLFLARHWLEKPRIHSTSTAKAAKDLAGGVLSKKTAVIGSREAAHIYKLKIAAKDIQDNRFNFTQFVVIAKSNIQDSFDIRPLVKSRRKSS